MEAIKKLKPQWLYALALVLFIVAQFGEIAEQLGRVIGEALR